MPKTENQTVLALYPNRYGIGYAVFDHPEELVEFGIGYVRPLNLKKSFKRVKGYISYYKPDVIIVRSTDSSKKVGKRNAQLIEKICKEARLQGLEVHSYTRTQIKDVFLQFQVKSKFQISQKLIEWYPKLKPYRFPKQKAWMGENHNTGIFDAVSLAMTYYYLE